MVTLGIVVEKSKVATSCKEADLQTCVHTAHAPVVRGRHVFLHIIFEFLVSVYLLGIPAVDPISRFGVLELFLSPCKCCICTTKQATSAVSIFSL